MLRPLAAAALAATLLAPTRAAALENEDLLSLVAMPLAVAAVSEITDVPTNQLMDVVTLLNDAAVPPQQFIEVVRYVPVALLAEVQPNEPTFVEYVRLREQQGLRGTALVTSIAERLTHYDLPELDLAVERSRTIDVVEGSFIPPIVRTRIAERRNHPHGGPPGQLKKDRGLQTGAEVVHGARPNRGRDDRKTDSVSERVVTRVVDDNVKGKDRDRDGRRERTVRPRKVETHREVARPANSDRGGKSNRGGGRGNGNGKGNAGGGNGKGNGKGKGKG